MGTEGGLFDPAPAGISLDLFGGVDIHDFLPRAAGNHWQIPLQAEEWLSTVHDVLKEQGKEGLDQSPATALILRLVLWLFSGVGEQSDGTKLSQWWLSWPLSKWGVLFGDLGDLLGRLLATPFMEILLHGDIGRNLLVLLYYTAAEYCAARVLSGGNAEALEKEFVSECHALVPAKWQLWEKDVEEHPHDVAVDTSSILPGTCLLSRAEWILASSLHAGIGADKLEAALSKAYTFVSPCAMVDTRPANADEVVSEQYTGTWESLLLSFRTGFAALAALATAAPNRRMDRLEGQWGLCGPVSLELPGSRMDVMAVSLGQSAEVEMLVFHHADGSLQGRPEFHKRGCYTAEDAHTHVFQCEFPDGSVALPPLGTKLLTWKSSSSRIICPWLPVEAPGAESWVRLRWRGHNYPLPWVSWVDMAGDGLAVKVHLCPRRQWGTPPVAIAACSRSMFDYDSVARRWPRLLDEWLAYHRMLGIDKFLISDLDGSMEPYLQHHIAAGYVEYFAHWPAEPAIMRIRRDPFCTIFLNFDHCLFEARGRAEHLLLLKAPDKFLYSAAGHGSFSAWLRSAYPEPLRRNALCSLAVRRMEFGTGKDSEIEPQASVQNQAGSPIDVYSLREPEALPAWVHSGVLMQPELVLYADNARAVCRERSETAEVDAHDWVLNHYFEFMTEDAPPERGGGRRCSRCEVYDDGLLHSPALLAVRSLMRRQATAPRRRQKAQEQLQRWRQATHSQMTSASEVAMNTTLLSVTPSWRP